MAKTCFPEDRRTGSASTRPKSLVQNRHSSPLTRLGASLSIGATAASPAVAASLRLSSNGTGGFYGATSGTSRGVYSKPTVARLPVGGKGLGFPDLHFDAQQYRAEVARATLDRSWETKARETARLLHECLDQGHDQLARQGWRSSWVSPHHQKANMFRVAFWDLDARHQVVVEVTAEPAPSPEQAELMARFLLQTPPENW